MVGGNFCIQKERYFLGGFFRTYLNFYVVDLVTGEQTEDQALFLNKKASERLGKGGFKLRKWSSNSQKVQRFIESKLVGVG